MGADKVIVSGYLVRCPLGGYAWQVLHYLIGLRQLGFEPYFYEDTSSFSECFDPRTGNMTDDPRPGVSSAGEFLARYGFAGRWAFWDTARDVTYGLGAADRVALLNEARLVISLAGVNRLPKRAGRPMVFIDLDPAFTQIRAAEGDRALRELLSHHDVCCTLGENIGHPECLVPTAGLTWHPTRQPVALDLWAPQPRDDAAAFTTVGRWDEQRREVHFDGETYSWRKRVEWMRFLDLPQRTGERFAVAMDVAKIPEDVNTLERHGWTVRDPIAVSADAEAYRDFIRRSKGEFTVAKDLNVRLATGWFSDRSACYLAAGRPVVTQDTAFDRVLPTGVGLFAFRTPDQAAAAVRAIAADWPRQAQAARQVAEKYFDGGAVVRDLLGLL